MTNRPRALRPPTNVTPLICALLDDRIVLSGSTSNWRWNSIWLRSSHDRIALVSMGSRLASLPPTMPSWPMRSEATVVASCQRQSIAVRGFCAGLTPPRWANDHWVGGYALRRLDDINRPLNAVASAPSSRDRSTTIVASLQVVARGRDMVNSCG
jgi:hypothetical protein